MQTKIFFPQIAYTIIILFHTQKFDNLDKMAKFIKVYSLPKLSKEEIVYLISPITI